MENIYKTENDICVIGCMDNKIDNTLESANRVYSINGVCPTIPTCQGGVYVRRYL